MKLRNLITESDEAKAQKDMMNQLKKVGLAQFGPMASKVIKKAWKSTGTIDERKTVSIKPSSLGLMAPMFKSINLEVNIVATYGTGPGYIAVIRLRYDYQHPSGSNGYERAWKYMQGSWREW